MESQKKLTNERLIQAKAFLDNGVITQEQFIEMPHGQAEPEATDETQVLGRIFDRLTKIEQRLLGIESSLSLLAQKIQSRE